MLFETLDAIITEMMITNARLITTCVKRFIKSEDGVPPKL